ncbi:hypothetical protein LHYA1_G004914 [Lachnellula hyalina]|uniref:DNA repair protein XRCC4 n=1 Tax=Lachnellula hyalina TaxID=1316788 RepID=A0A8H8R370_9HELO|nr:uncharacterized protein LHYA1_G004914 [Lachnellula hyalina]TVY27673.1 hypothetical protein LHYA1_G004914 [Lachnellula hyalina]
MALESPVLLRLPRGLDQTEFVLLHISSEGHRPLDLKLVGTENETVFKIILEHDRTSSLKDSKSKLNQEQWDAVLSTILLGAVLEEEHKAILQGVEAVAKVESGENRLSITIQRRIEGITQRLGSLILQETEDEEPDLFEWCGQAVESKRISTTELQALKSIIKSKDEQFKKLEESFAELVDLKNGHEKSLFEKFSLLLNEKKLKIRDQQRLLASSNVDPAKLEALEAIRRDSGSRSAGPSRKGKRKADENIEENESDEGFEKMDVDQEPPHDSEDEDQRQRTPDAESTADETESEGEAPPSSPPRRKTVETKSGGQTTVQSSSSTVEADAPPSKRNLPERSNVSKAVRHSPPPKSAPILDGSETESDDDEL